MEGTKFQPVLVDPESGPQVHKLIMCSGKIYYELHRERANRKLEQDIGILRLEELCPFPFNSIGDVLAGLPELREIVWVQEEARNQGPWPHVEPRLRALIGSQRFTSQGIQTRYWGRREDAVPAVGVSKKYKDQQAKVISGAFERNVD